MSLSDSRDAFLAFLCYAAQVLGPSQSKWWPYLRLLPELSEIKPPVTYSQAEMNLLKGGFGTAPTTITTSSIEM